MAIISETSDDGYNGGDPTKNPQEDENPKEDDQEENFAPVHLPEPLIESILAPLRRCDYPSLSLIARSFRDVISSEQLFAARSQLGLTEPVLYTLIMFPPFDWNPSWFILHRSNISLRLSRVSLIPTMLRGSISVTIGHKIYVMGGCVGFNNRPVKTVTVIDCRFHKWKYLESMQRKRCYAAAGVIDGKIYVVGGRERRYDDWVEVYDVENGNWETVPGPSPPVVSASGVFTVHLVLDNKIYILDGTYCLAYDPRRCRWETWGLGSQQRFNWHASSCVVDDCLYAIVPEFVSESRIQVYNPRDMVWRPVKGVDHLPKLCYAESRMANFGGKLLILGCYQSLFTCDDYSQKQVWCVEVALEKREDGDIWGKLESISLVHSFLSSPFFVLSRTVTV